MNLLNNLPEDKAIDKFIDTSFDVAERVHQLMKEKGINQKELADILGKKESEISRWMSGTHNFTLKTIAKIEVVLGGSVVRVTSTGVEGKVPKPV